MNHETIGLIIFAFISLSAVFAFIFVLGGPEATGNASGYLVRTATQACEVAADCDGLPGLPTGNYDAEAKVFECYCPNQPNLVFYRSELYRATIPPPAYNTV